MKMTFRSLSLAALLLSASGSAIADQGSTSSVGDLPGYGNATYETESTPAYDNSQSVVSPSYTEDDSAGLQQTTFVGNIGSGIRNQTTRRPIRRVSRRMTDVFSGGDRWVQAEMLLWFPQARSSAPLITTAPLGTAPELGVAGTSVAFGGEGELDGGLSAGFRFDAGKYLTDDFGIGGRFWILHENADNAYYEGNGTNMAIGRPFFDTNLPGQNSVLISQGGAGGGALGAGDFAGQVYAESSLNIWAGEIYGRLKFGGGSNFQTDVIGGYTHFDIEDDLMISSTTIQTNPATGETWEFSDNFNADNKFDGGQLGFESVVTQGRWALRTLTKVHMGNMNQTVSVAGTHRNYIGAPTPAQPNGMLALDASGTYEREVFTFAPEVNFKLAYRFRPNVLLSLGYSFIYWDNVAQAGDYVDPQFDGSTLATAGPYGQGNFQWKDSSLWTQGIDVGFILDY